MSKLNTQKQGYGSMACFDDIPEDREPSFPCTCGGDIKENEFGEWVCTLCDREY